MKTIYKYHLKDTVNKIEMHEGAFILSVQAQEHSIFLWASVDTEKPKVERTFLILGTGNRIPDTDLGFIGTLQQGSYVWHVFEDIRKLSLKDGKTPMEVK